LVVSLAVAAGVAWAGCAAPGEEPGQDAGPTEGQEVLDGRDDDGAAGEAADGDCPAGRTRCGASCVDLGTDPGNCGTCGHTCDASEVCNEGRCASTCAGGLLRCGGSCVDPATDEAHCGYPENLPGCNIIGFQFDEGTWGGALNWGSSTCGMPVTTWSATTYPPGTRDFHVDRGTASRSTVRLGTLEGIFACTTLDNVGEAWGDVFAR
jgi:hypothetical protein